MPTRRNKIERLLMMIVVGGAVLMGTIVLVATIIVVSVPLAYAADAGDCFDIVGSGKPVLVGGIPNSGVMNFDPVAGPIPAFQYEGCVDDPDIPPETNRAADNNFGAPGANYYQVKGWVWDTNLGWISLFCEGGLNEGAACGGFNYGVTIDSNGYFHGWAWGDNIGWISFNCGDVGAAGCGVSNYQPYVETTDADCMGYVYGSVSPKPAFCAGHPEAERATHVWADSVGWIDLDGIGLPWVALTNEIGTVTLEIKPDVPANYDKLTPATPLADGSDAYYFEVYVEDKDGFAFNPGDPNRYQVRIDPDWTRDSVKLDQTVDGITPTYTACEAGGAVGKFCDDTLLSVAAVGYYESTDITSDAPTSNMNGADTDLDGVVDFPYETFIAPDSMASKTFDSNDLELAKVDVRIVDTDFMGTAGECAYPISAWPCIWANPAPDGVGPHEFKYAPSTEVEILNGPTSDEYIELDVEKDETFTASGRGGDDVYFTAWDGTDLKLVYDTDSDGDRDWDDSHLWNLVGSSINNLILRVVQNPGSQPPQTVGGLYIYSIVDDGGGIRYFSNKLPRVIGSTAIQPVAVPRGNIYTSGYTTTTSAVEMIRSIGDVNTNILRNTIFRNVSAIVAGASVTAGNDVIKTTGGKLDIVGTNGATLLPDDSGDPTVFYFKGDLTIGDGGVADVTWSGNRTVIVSGGNVYIRNNIYNGPATDDKLGIIVLRDLTSPNKASQGHVYVYNDVTNIQANIFADGSVFPWDGVVAFNAIGEPQFGTLDAAKTALENYQLFIEGSIASQNTVGGSRVSPPVTGTGVDANDELHARLYDLNYLRYYSGLVKRNPATGAARCLSNATGLEEDVATDAEFAARLKKPDGEPWSVYEDIPGLGRGCLWPPDEASGGGGTFVPANDMIEATDLGATYIYYDPPSPNLPGFTYSRGVETTQRAQ